MKKLLFLACIILSFTFCRDQNNQLPKPSGKYLTGVSYLNLIDSSRKELFDNEGKKYRELTIKVWYPADKKTEPELYLENPEILVDNFGFTAIYRTLKTNSSRGVAISQTEVAYPVLIYSHGWGEHFSQNTILMEELASHGYIVFSIAHHYECKFSFYPDGRFITIDNNSDRFNKIMEEQMNPAAMEIFKEMVVASNDKERGNVFLRTMETMPFLMKESPSYWADDIKFFVSALGKINKSDPGFKGKLDLKKIGVLGMSMGGIATNEVCLKDGKVKAGLNIDGALYGSAINETLKIPYMFLNSQRYLGYGNLFTSRCIEDCYSVTVRNSDHYNFTDYAFYPVKNQGQIGTVDPAIPIKIMNSLAILFFNKYLRNESNIDLGKSCEGFDVEYVSNVHE
jgi:hypothetical protein